MFNFGPTFIYVIINFFVLYFVLKKILFGPVTKFMEERKSSITDSMEKAKKANEEAEELRKEYEEKLALAKDESSKIINEAKARGEREYNQIINDAKREAEAIKKKGKDEVSLERNQMIEEVKKKAAALVFAVAKKLLNENVDYKKNRELVDKFIKEVDAA